MAPMEKWLQGGVAWVLVFEYLHAHAKGHARGMVIRWGSASDNGGGTNGGRDAIHAGKSVETEHRVSEGIITFGRRRKGSPCTQKWRHSMIVQMEHSATLPM
ncbi:hypothetical protein MHU86_5861 [Fragilaria crotonensis]|nr:hypothetical protein MHU86_5861 [Fragilaria crotonensis]